MERSDEYKPPRKESFVVGKTTVFINPDEHCTGDCRTIAAPMDEPYPHIDRDCPRHLATQRIDGADGRFCNGD